MLRLLIYRILILILALAPFNQVLAAYPMALSAADFPQVPEKPLRNLIFFLDENFGRELKIKFSSQKSSQRKLVFRRYAAIVDFSQPSNEPRLYVLDLFSKQSVAYRVTHGRMSGDILATQFSNKIASNMSALGFYMTDLTYLGQFGYSLKLFGLDSSNDNSYERNIVFHGANFASEAHFIQNGRLGLSEGCPAVDPKFATELIDRLNQGSIIYIYHPQLDSVTMAPTSSTVEVMGNNKQETSDNSNELVLEIPQPQMGYKGPQSNNE